MDNIEQLIVSHKMIKKNDIIGVAVSGGMDSMALLDVLYKLQEKLDFEVVALTVQLFDLLRCSIKRQRE